MNAWMLTYTGRQFWPLNPRVEDVCIEDIAHALSNLCRFGGHVRTFYSVAQHCVHASHEVRPYLALAALLHDASEAYLCDLPRPIKQEMTNYQEFERQLEIVIQHAFNIDPNTDIREIDNQLLFTERRDLMPPGHWIIDESQCLKAKIVPWTARVAEERFIRRFRELT